MIHVAVGMSNLFSKFAGTAMLSMFENTKAEVTVHIMHDNSFLEENHDKFVKIAEQYNQQVKFYNVEELCRDEIEKIREYFPEVVKGRFTIIAYFRLLISVFFPKEIKKLIYLDSDIVVNLDIKELWNIELHENIFGAMKLSSNWLDEKVKKRDYDTLSKRDFCRDGTVKPEEYFNDGVLLIDMEKFREVYSKITATIEFFGSIPKHERDITYGCSDQILLNYCFSKNYLHLNKKYNTCLYFARYFGDYDVNEKIIHYTGTAKGIGLDIDMNDSYNRIFFKYFMKTPWSNENTIENIVKFFTKNYNQCKLDMIKVSTMMAGKERAFFTEHVSVGPMKKTFLVKENEEIIATAENEDLADYLDDVSFDDNGKIISYEVKGVLKTLLDSMKIFKGKKVFFLLVSGFYPKLYEILQLNGFVEYVDFINGDLFRCELSGEPLETYPCVLDL
ncbi:MAG: hypothetical protein IK062_03620 [Selenomonadaceae bacterium]|nr:hypothetical protein [Selenomonadaceae bacterium]